MEGVSRMPDTMTFEDKSKRMVRVVFEPDGTPLFCGRDLATIAGYKSPKGALDEGRIGVKSVKRKIWWSNSEKRGCAYMHCFTAENARRFLSKKPVQNEAMKWFLNTVIPEAEAIGKTKMDGNGTPKAPPEGVEVVESRGEEPHGQQPPASITERLDAIILECALLKRELCQQR